MNQDWWHKHGPAYTCPACGHDYYRNEMQRVGLVMYCRYCLSMDMVPGVNSATAAPAPAVQAPDICWVCGRLGCDACRPPEKNQENKK